MCQHNDFVRLTANSSDMNHISFSGVSEQYAGYLPDIPGITHNGQIDIRVCLFCKAVIGLADGHLNVLNEQLKIDGAAKRQIQAMIDGRPMSEIEDAREEAMLQPISESAVRDINTMIFAYRQTNRKSPYMYNR